MSKPEPNDTIPAPLPQFADAASQQQHTATPAAEAVVVAVAAPAKLPVIPAGEHDGAYVIV
jgi:hypothetical protein